MADTTIHGYSDDIYAAASSTGLSPAQIAAYQSQYPGIEISENGKVTYAGKEYASIQAFSAEMNAPVSSKIAAFGDKNDEVTIGDKDDSLELNEEQQALAEAFASKINTGNNSIVTLLNQIKSFGNSIINLFSKARSAENQAVNDYNQTIEEQISNIINNSTLNADEKDRQLASVLNTNFDENTTNNLLIQAAGLGMSLSSSLSALNSANSEMMINSESYSNIFTGKTMSESASSTLSLATNALSTGTGVYNENINKPYEVTSDSAAVRSELNSDKIVSNDYGKTSIDAAKDKVESEKASEDEDENAVALAKKTNK